MDVGRDVAWPTRPSRFEFEPPARRPPRISVLTPTLLEPGRAPYLLALHTDLAAATTDWEWIIVVDGAHERRVPEPIAADSRVRVLRVGRRIGAAAARNLGLGIAWGDYVTAADDDDHLPPGSLELRLAAATGHGVAWVGGLVADLRDGVTTVWDCPMPRGRAAPGDVWRAWRCPCLPFPLGPTTLLIATDALRQVGGWHGLPQAEDFGMALAVTGRAGGLVLDQVVYLYRRHAAQMTTRPDFDELEALVRHITYERGRLSVAAPPVSTAGGRDDRSHPRPGDTAAGGRSRVTWLVDGTAGRARPAPAMSQPGRSLGEAR